MKSVDLPPEHEVRPQPHLQGTKDRDRLARQLRESEERLAQARADVSLLAELSGKLIREQQVGELYDAILAAAGVIMASDYASLQLLQGEDTGQPELHLLAHRGFDRRAEAFWARVGMDSVSTCGEALRTRRRVVVPDVRTCTFMRESADLATLNALGVCAVQTTPLFSRQGRLVGMISTHWRYPHSPSERALGLLDVIARQAADLIEQARSRQDLLASEQRLRSIFARATSGLAQTDLEGKFTLVNESFCHMTGYSRAELLRMRMQDITHPDDLARNLRQFERLAAGGEDYIVEKRFVRKDGSLLWVHKNAALLRDAAGQPHSAVAVMTDVSDRKRSELMLAEQKDILEKIASGRSLEECLLAICAAASRLNPGARAAVRLAGREPRGVGARLVSESLDHGVAEELAAAALTRNERGAPLTVADVATASLPEQTKTACAAHGVRGFHAVPVPGSDGRTLAFLLLAFDAAREPDEWELRVTGFGAHAANIVIERDQSQQSLEEREERLRLSFAAASIGAWELNLETMEAQVHSMQHDRIFGYPDKLEHWSFARLLEHVHPEDRDEVRRSFDTALRSRNLACECRILRADGALRWITLQGALYGDEGERPVRAIGIVKDVTDRRQAEDALRQADRRKDEFLATLAHELRNPLAPIRTGLELLRMLGDERNVVNDALRRMETQMGHLVRLVDDLLDLSRITSGKVTLRKTLLELGGVIRTTAEALRPELADAGHRLELVLPEQPLHVLADETRVAQIVSNLVNNASKYTPAGGRIGIRVTHEDGHAIVRVSDNGMGIPAAMLERIFEMFVQVERNVDRMQAGLGIGLTLVKRLVEMHGGTIAAASEGAGKGSTFEVRLPVAAPVAVARPAKKEPDARRRRLRVLVADDNEDAVLLLAAVIEMLGHDVCAATDGRQAVAYARDWRPDLVLMDLGMPRLNGIEAARRIRREPWGHDLPLVALTGWGQEDDKRATKAAGFDRHLTKPVDAEALSALLSGDQALVSP